MTDYCEKCGQPLPVQRSAPTERELDVLAAWWGTKDVRQAAKDCGITYQRAKNLLAHCRFRSGVHSNEALLTRHMDALHSRIASVRSQNIDRSAA